MNKEEMQARLDKYKSTADKRKRLFGKVEIKKEAEKDERQK